MGRSPQARSFTPEFKAEMVELCQREDRSGGQVARSSRRRRRSIAMCEKGVRAAGGLAGRLPCCARWQAVGPGAGRRRWPPRSRRCTRIPGAATARRGFTRSCATKGGGIRASGSPG